MPTTLGRMFDVRPWHSGGGPGYLINSRDLGDLAWSESYDYATRIAAALEEHARCLERPAPSSPDHVQLAAVADLLERAHQVVHQTICPVRAHADLCRELDQVSKLLRHYALTT